MNFAFGIVLKNSSPLGLSWRPWPEGVPNCHTGLVLTAAGSIFWAAMPGLVRTSAPVCCLPTLAEAQPGHRPPSIPLSGSCCWALAGAASPAQRIRHHLWAHHGSKVLVNAGGHSMAAFENKTLGMFLMAFENKAGLSIEAAAYPEHPSGHLDIREAFSRRRPVWISEVLPGPGQFGPDLPVELLS